MLHFLASGCRTPAGIASYVELIRDGDLAMRRYFGPRLRESLRIRAGELLVTFDTNTLAQATSFDPFYGFDVGNESGPVWNGSAKAERSDGIDPRRLDPPKSKILRTVAGIDECTKAMRGDIVVAYMRPDDQIAGVIVPAPVRLCNLWKDQVSIADLGTHCERLGLGGDPMAILQQVYGDYGNRPYVVVGEDLHFAPGKLTGLYAQMAAMQTKSAQDDQENLISPNPPRIEEP